MNIRKPKHMYFENKGIMRSGFGHIFMAMFLYLAGSLVVGIIQSPIMVSMMLKNKEYMNMVKSGNPDFSKITELVYKLMENRTPLYNALFLIGYIGLAIVVIIYWKGFKKRSTSHLGMTDEKMLSGSFVGILMGGLGAFIIISFLKNSGVIRFEGIDRSSLTPVLLVALLGFIMKAFAEEILCRGFLFTACSEGYSVLNAAISSSLFYTLIHETGGKATFTTYINGFLFGLISCALVVAFDNIWGAVFFHAIWDFVSHIIFGLHVEGQSLNGAIYRFYSYDGGATVHNGGASGIEGSSMATAMLVLLLVIAYAILKLTGNILTREEAIKAKEEREALIQKKTLEFFDEFNRKYDKYDKKNQEEPKQYDPYDPKNPANKGRNLYENNPYNQGWYNGQDGQNGENPGGQNPGWQNGPQNGQNPGWQNGPQNGQNPGWQNGPQNGQNTPNQGPSLNLGEQLERDSNERMRETGFDGSRSIFNASYFADEPRKEEKVSAEVDETVSAEAEKAITEDKLSESESAENTDSEDSTDTNKNEGE
ncbi:MAG: CPBP family intramembrane metalloprotease [Lachnospiraceae bacterium]|nr:CPBP family intramembrane metalloprotease [Lachnospiraceae bacterium]